MKKLMNIFTLFLTMILSIHAAEINDSAALNGIKETKSIFLLDMMEISKTAAYLRIIEGTHKGLTSQGVKPDMVLVFIGPTVRFLSSKQDEATEMEYDEELKSIQISIKNLSTLGARIEVCNIATQAFNVENKSLPPEVHIVGDGFISLIGWQTQGHKLVPVF